MPGVGGLLRLKPLLPILGAAVFGVILAVFSWLMISTLDKQRATDEFNEAAADHLHALEMGLATYFNNLTALGALFNASSHGVTREEFSIFSRNILTNQPAILGLSWIPQVTREGRAAHEAAARKDGVQEYQIREINPDNSLSVSPEHEEYFPIYYSSKEPFDSNLYGLDLRDGNGVRQQMMDKARDEDRIIASRTLKVRSGSGDRTGFLVVRPVYETGKPYDTLESRRDNLEGFVLGVFQIGTMVTAILKNVTPPLNLFLFEPGADSNDRAIYEHSPNLKAGSESSVTLAEASRGQNWTGHLNVSGRQWIFVASPSGSPSADGHHRATIVAAAILILTLMVMAYMWKSYRHAHRLVQMARTDSLTALPNRVVFAERLVQAISASRRNGNRFALHFLDIDGFKEVNDTLGHATGDALLVALVKRLKAELRENDIMARFGGDEFAILQTDANEPEAAAALAERLNKVVAAPFDIAENEVTVTGSIGITLQSDAVRDPDAMMIQADLALYRAKEDGRNCYRFYSPVLDQQVRTRFCLTEGLRAGIKRGELELLYQPQVAIQSGRILGLEALVRWNHPTRGLIMPSLFIPLAEKSAIMHQLGSWVFEAACAQLAKWNAEGLCPEVLAVNVSGIQLRRIETFERDIANSLAKWNIGKGIVELELTETVLMEASGKQGDALQRLREMGLRIAIDDFGTGYSSLKYLTVYPVNRLKIAQELVFGVADDPRNAAVVKTAIRLARELQIEVIAEGVETEAQARFLLREGCDSAQGYYYSRPINAEAATALLRCGSIHACSSHFLPMSPEKVEALHASDAA